MANKALILGAAMAYKNQGSPLVGSITKAVDASLGSYLKIMEAEQQKLSKASLITQQYLDSLPANPEIDLLDDNLSTMFTSELNSARNEIGRLNMIRYADPFTYSPGSEAYTNITSAIKAQEKILKDRLIEATTLQQAKGNWVNEHSVISETWKRLNDKIYKGLTKILSPGKEDYTATRDKDGKLVFSTIYDGEKIDIKVEDLDWGQFPQPEINKINEFFEIAQNAGQQGLDLGTGQVNMMRTYFDSVLKSNENALFSLMFDELPMGKIDQKMALFTEEDFEKMFPNADYSDQTTWPDINEMRNQTVNTIISKIIEENKNFKNKSGSEFAKGFNDFAFNYAEFKSGIAPMQYNTEKEILEYIEKNSPYSGIINATDKDGKIFFGTGSAQTQALRAFDVNNEIKIFKDTGNTTPLITKLIRELYAGDDQANNVTQLISQFENLSSDKQDEFFSNILRGTN